MISLWSFLVSLVIFFASLGAAVYSFRDGNRIAIVLALDAAIISALGLLLNATTRGELQTSDLLVFCALPLALAIAASAICRFYRPAPSADVAV
ncbi:hypothetical protein [Subtercola endophyticus]|uniref:hypothetical protein n=1 Tax=Subtercola endophyticus TaxID=2895559 RepID=UPI001E560E5B|nr:hypothetical protein [Subtercola endophyticus]UFS59412.1 hypothetical protein LQ955_01025 [Subtercola endophyticus]